MRFLPPACREAARTGNTWRRILSVMVVLCFAVGPVSAGKGKGAEALDKKLLDAAVHGNVEEVVRLLTEGANPDVFNDFGETPLHLAAIGGNVEVVKALISSGANINTLTIQGPAAVQFQGNEKRTPLMWFADSCQVCPPPIVHFLLVIGVFFTNERVACDCRFTGGRSARPSGSRRGQDYPQ
eukprot:3430300-Rhodomonas_salina.1